MNSHPRGWQHDQVQHRFASTEPASYSADTRSVEAVLSAGTDVRRAFGIERLEISKRAVDLSRLASGTVPLLDAHSSASIRSVLGRVTDVWFANNKLMGRLVFADTKEGKHAEEMVRQRMISSVSIGYTIQKWRVEDSKDDDDPVYIAERWQLVEVSLVGTPADENATIRSLGGGHDPQFIHDTRARMMARHRLSLRQAMYDDQAALDD